MRKKLANPLFLLLLLFVVGCQKEFVNRPKNEGDKKSFFQGLKRFEYKPTVINLTSFSKEDPEVLLNQRKQNTVTFLRDSIWPDNSGKTSFYESTEIPAVLPETRRQLYLGAIIRGDQAIDVDNFKPMQIDAIHRNPITMYANFPTDSIYLTTLPSPIQDARYIRGALLAGSGQQIQSFTYEQNQFRKMEELKKSFGANLNIGNIFSADFLDTTAAGQTKTRVRAEFTQENFSVAIEPPIYEPFLKESFDIGQFNGVEPLIVSSVTYGRKGMFFLGV